MVIRSKLADVGTTIFSTMTALANAAGAINLAQGFPDYPCDPTLGERMAEAIAEGHNQYAPMPGHALLRMAVASLWQRRRGTLIDADSDVTITPGATAALFTAIATIVSPGDDVVILTPAYDSYAPAVRTLGGRVVAVPMNVHDGLLDWTKLADAITERTSLVIVNTPHNPTGTVMSLDDVDTLASIMANTNALLLSDEVYDHIVFDGLRHVSPAGHPALAEKTIVVTSFGKTLHVTGWKVGALIAPSAITRELRKVHQFLSFSVHTPTQIALGRYLEQTSNTDNVAAFFQAKRDLFVHALRGSSWTVLPCQGTYFQLLGYGTMADIEDVEAAKTLTTAKGVASIPLSPFMEGHESAGSLRYLRFCFAKRDETLLAAADRLKNGMP
ncbi:MAG: methionine aminotransferase [Candidatus Kapabacteria bacterium]|jgi:methionine aminotransferase|nr:methionine aminotransferase [Candidatus Kapabacteria bacterium]